MADERTIEAILEPFTGYVKHRPSGLEFIVVYRKDEE